MTRPKKWFLAEDYNSVVIKYADESLAKTPKAVRALGEVTAVSTTTLAILYVLLKNTCFLMYHQLSKNRQR